MICSLYMPTSIIHFDFGLIALPLTFMSCIKQSLPTGTKYDISLSICKT